MHNKCRYPIHKQSSYLGPNSIITTVATITTIVVAIIAIKPGLVEILESKISI